MKKKCGRKKLKCKKIKHGYDGANGYNNGSSKKEQLVI
jgi:hypothetical protein